MICPPDAVYSVLFVCVTVTKVLCVGPFTRAELAVKVFAGDTITFRGVHPVSSDRTSLDRDWNGQIFKFLMNGDENRPSPVPN